jgi:hypothetical protein
MSADESSTRTLDRRSVIVEIVSVILILEIVSALAIIGVLDTWTDRASFGGMFGAVSSLFSGLALAGVVYAILLQREELSLQRQELQLTRHELERSAVAQEQSAQLLRDQLSLMREGQERQTMAERRNALPLFKPQSWSSIGARMDFELVNYGAPISDLKVRNVIAATASLLTTSVVESGGRLKMVIETGSSTFSFELVFTDMRGERRATEISFNAANGRLDAREVAA